MTPGEARAFRLLGLGARGRHVAVGVERTRAATFERALVLAIVARDASHHSKEKFIPLLTARNVAMIEAGSAAELGAAVGRTTTAVVGVLDAGLARGVRAALEEDRRLGE